MDIIIDLILGALAGFVGSKLFSGAGKGLIIDCVIGIVGGAIGGQILGWLGLGASSRWGGFVVAVIGAILLLWVVSLLSKKK